MGKGAGNEVVVLSANHNCVYAYYSIALCMYIVLKNKHGFHYKEKQW